MRSPALALCLLSVAAGPLARPSSPRVPATRSSTTSPAVARLPQLQSDVARAASAVADARHRLEEARRAAIDAASQTDEYREASDDFAAKESRLNQARASGSMQDRLAAGTAYSHARQTLDTMTKTALANDPSVKSAATTVAIAEEALVHAKAAVDDERLRLADAEEARLANDPINKAMHEHRILKGMTKQQAIHAFGSPPVRTDLDNGVEIYYFEEKGLHEVKHVFNPGNYESVQVDPYNVDLSSHGDNRDLQEMVVRSATVEFRGGVVSRVHQSSVGEESDPPMK